MEFIYKSAGVNRPLTPSDNPDKNLNKTFYRDQINKVANAVKEIITAIKKHNQEDGEIPKEVVKAKPEHPKNLKPKIILGTLLVLALIMLGYYFIPKLFESSKSIEKSIAVLPFINDSPDQENAYFINGIMDEILNNLQKIKDFRVLSRTSAEGYRGTTKPALPEIAKKLGVNYIVEGSGQKYGNTVRLSVQLIQAKGKETNLWTKSYEQEIAESKDIFSIQSQIAQAIAIALKTKLTPEEKQVIEKPPTISLTAYNFYLRGKEEIWKFGMAAINREAVKRAEILFKKALEYDSTFARAYTGLAFVYWKKNFYEENFSKNFLDSMLVLADIALSYDDKLAEAYYIRGGYYAEKGNTNKALAEYDKAIKFNPNDWEAYFGKGWLYNDDLLKSIENYQKAVSLNHGSELTELLRSTASLYYQAGFPEKGKEYNLEALNLDGDSSKYLYILVDYESSTGNYKKTLDLLKKIYRIDSTYTDFDEQFGLNYMDFRQFKESLKYLKKWVEKLKATGVVSFNGMHRIGYVYWVNGYKKEAEYYFDKQMKYCYNLIKSYRPNEQSFYAYYDLAGVYAFRGDKEKAYENLKFFNQKQRFQLWMVTLIKTDPLFNSIRNEPEFQQIAKDVEAKYQAEHERVRKWLEEQGML